MYLKETVFLQEWKPSIAMLQVKMARKADPASTGIKHIIYNSSSIACINLGKTYNLPLFTRMFNFSGKFIVVMYEKMIMNAI